MWNRFKNRDVKLLTGVTEAEQMKLHMEELRREQSIKIEQNLVDIIKSFHGTWITKNSKAAAGFSNNR